MVDDPKKWTWIFVQDDAEVIELIEEEGFIRVVSRCVPKKYDLENSLGLSRTTIHQEGH